MDGFVQGEDRMQRTLLPDSLEDYVGEDNQVRVVDVFIDELDLAATEKANKDAGVEFRLPGGAS